MPDGILRIGDRARFEALRVTRHRGRRGPVAVAFVPAADRGEQRRVAYAIGRRVGSAVVRNRLRRRLRVVMRQLAADGRLPAGAYLVSGTRGAEQLSFAALVDAVTSAVGTATKARAR